MMSHPNAFYLHISALSTFSADGNIYRAFDHLIAARMGTVLLAPIHAVQGDLTQVVDGCPVPWEEVGAVLDAPFDQASDFGLDDYYGYGSAIQQMARLAAVGWDMELLRLRPEASAVWAFRHVSGLRYAVTGDLIFEEDGA
ncbi:MAG: hypothetical protein KJ958_00865 [Gammaproteobacteria bacterium]|nr:hypothetical protein [Gammaproteobacteria bacterium]MBU1977698.1 hypothetical protein [Gammaproteobacteria bacterium]